MKKVIHLLSLLLSIPAFAQQEGYEINVTLKPFSNQYVYLGHYLGKQYPIVDSAMLNEKSETVFRGKKKLGGGIYLIGYPNKSGFFEVLVDKQQHFSIIADTATLNIGIRFENSPDNTLFNSYQKELSTQGVSINSATKQLKAAINGKDSAYWSGELVRLDDYIKAYRENIIKNNPDNILSMLLKAMREPELPDSLKIQKTKTDSINAYLYFKNHYWDGVNFWDGRLARTTLFEFKLDKYINEVMYPHQDSVIKDIDWMLGYASIDEELTKFLLLKFVNRYLNQKHMWEDAVFVHLFEKYFANKSYTWLTESGRKTITDRAYNLMSNIMGSPAADIQLPDSAGKVMTLYNQPAAFTLVCFWDPLCGHCKEVVPKIDSLYHAKWKAWGLKVYAVAKETDGNKNDWTSFINKYHLQNWTNVYYTKANEKSRVESGIPSYSQLYDVQTYPTLYLLDKDKKIIAKKLTPEQIDNILKLKMKDP